MSVIDKKIKQTRLKLFTKDLLFFGMMALRFKWSIYKFAEDIQNSIGFVQFSKENLNKLEAGGIHLNQDFLEKDDFSFLNTIHVICHELFHILHHHGSRIDMNDSTYDHNIANIAADHVIEVILKRMNNIFTPYRGNYNIVPELYQELPNCTFEEAYDWLMKYRKKCIKDMISNGQMLEVDLKDGTKLVISTVKSNGENLSKEELKTIQDQLISEARAMNEHLKQKGEMSGSIATYIDKLLEIKLPWDSIVEKSIKTNTILKPDEYSWRKLNKYYAPHGINLPGLAMVESRDQSGILIIGIDSSGSMSKKDFEKFGFIIEKSMMFFKEILLIIHDVEIHQIKHFDISNIHSFRNFLCNEGIKGRGGTSHKYFFDHVQKLCDDEGILDDLSMVFSLTDMISDIELIYMNYNWISCIPLIFVSTHMKSINFKHKTIQTIMIN